MPTERKIVGQDGLSEGEKKEQERQIRKIKQARNFDELADAMSGTKFEDSIKNIKFAGKSVRAFIDTDGLRRDYLDHANILLTENTAFQIHIKMGDPVALAILNQGREILENAKNTEKESLDLPDPTEEPESPETSPIDEETAPVQEPIPNTSAPEPIISEVVGANPPSSRSAEKSDLPKTLEDYIRFTDNLSGLSEILSAYGEKENREKITNILTKLISAESKAEERKNIAENIQEIRNLLSDLDSPLKEKATELVKNDLARIIGIDLDAPETSSSSGNNTNENTPSLPEKMNEDPRFLRLVNDFSKKYFLVDNPNFSKEFSGAVSVNGHMMSADGKETNFLPSQIIGVESYHTALKEAAKRFKELYPEDSQEYEKRKEPELIISGIAGAAAENISAPEKKITAEELKEKIVGAKSLAELADTLEKLEEIPTSSGDYTKTMPLAVLLRDTKNFAYIAPEAIKSKVDNFWNLYQDRFTRQGGLREKVYSLLSAILENPEAHEESNGAETNEMSKPEMRFTGIEDLNIEAKNKPIRPFPDAEQAPPRFTDIEESPLDREAVEGEIESTIEEVLSEPATLEAATEAMSPESTSEEKQKIKEVLSSPDAKESLMKRIKKQMRDPAFWRDLAIGTAAGGTTRMVVRNSIRFALGPNILVGIAAGGIAGGLGAGVVELIKEKRMMLGTGALEKLKNATDNLERAKIYGELKRIYGEKKISGTAEEIEAINQELIQTETILKTALETKDLEGKDKISAILKISDDSRESLSKEERKEVKKLLKEIKFERGPADWKKISKCATKGAIMGSIGGALGGALSSWLSGNLNGGNATEKALEKASAAKKAAGELWNERYEAWKSMKEPISRAQEVVRETTTSTRDSLSSKFFAVTTEKGEGVTHLARKAIHEYLANDTKLNGTLGNTMNTEKLVYAEDYLQKQLTPLNAPTLHPGDSFQIEGNKIAEALEKAGVLNEEQISSVAKVIESNGGLSEESKMFISNPGFGVLDPQNDFVEAISKNTPVISEEINTRIAEGSAKQVAENAVSDIKEDYEYLSKVEKGWSNKLGSRLFEAQLIDGVVSSGIALPASAIALFSNPIDEYDSYEKQDPLEKAKGLEDKYGVTLEHGDDQELTSESVTKLEGILEELSAQSDITGLTFIHASNIDSGLIVDDYGQILVDVENYNEVKPGAIQEAKDKTAKMKELDIFIRSKKAEIIKMAGKSPMFELIADEKLTIDETKKQAEAVFSAVQEALAQGIKLKTKNIIISDYYDTAKGGAKFGVWINQNSKKEEIVEFLKKTFA